MVDDVTEKRHYERERALVSRYLSSGLVDRLPAKWLQENAQPGQILVCHKTWEVVRDGVQANPLPATRVRGRQTFTRVYELVNVVDTR